VKARRSKAIQLRVVPRELTAADRLFLGLDRQRVVGRAITWVVEILGIVVEGREAWVQVAPAGYPSRSVVVRVSSSLEGAAERALSALKAWSDDPVDHRRPRVVDARA
jgi:hypothetical protein